jgi:hypothetical protein
MELGSLGGQTAGYGDVELGTLDLPVKAQRKAAYLLQLAWKAHVVRTIMWRRKKVNI